MTEATVSPRSLSKVELKMLNDFMTTLSAREITGQVTVTKLILSYTEQNGYEITLEEKPKTVSSPVPVDTTTIEPTYPTTV